MSGKESTAGSASRHAIPAYAGTVLPFLPPSAGSEEAEILRGCVRWFVSLRWIAIAGIVAAVVIARYLLQVISSAAPLFAVTLGLAAFNTVMERRARAGLPLTSERARRLILVQVGADLLALTLLLHFAGSHENPFFFFYLFHIVISGILLGRPASLGVAAASILLFGGMVFLEGLGIFPHYDLRGYAHDQIALDPAGSGSHLFSFVALLSAFAMTALFLCYFIDLMTSALRASLGRETALNAKSRAVLESMREGVILFDERGRVAACNAAAQGLHACSATLAEAACPCPRSGVDTCSVQGIVADILAGRRDRHDFESAKENQVVLNTIGPVAGPGGRPIGVVWVLVDLTEVRRLQMEVLQHERSAVLAELSALVAHDIGNMLDGTLNGLRILEASVGDPEACAKWARELRMRVEQMPGVIRGLVELSRRKRLHREIVDVGEVIRRAVHMSGFRARQRGIRFEEEIGAVPTVEGDGIYLTMAVMNLLLNAYDAAGRGGHVRLAVRTAGGDAGTVEILVEDDGCGIRPEDLGKIFEPFYTTKSESGGSGLGLTIARRIVEEHGGTIRVTSAPGTGSTFAIAIPAARKLAAVGAAGGA